MTDQSEPYRLHRAAATPSLDAAWDDPTWSGAEPLTLGLVHRPPGASDHEPGVTAQVLYDDDHLYVRFRVEDQYVRAVEAGHQAMVCYDSCVEFFISPLPGRGYFNLEVSCGGHLHLVHHTPDDPKRSRAAVTDEWMDRIAVWKSLPARVEPEIAEPVTWYVAAALPFALFEDRLGPVPRGPGARWRGNFFKCADHCSHPHWLSWRPVGQSPFTFHHPATFGELEFV